MPAGFVGVPLAIAPPASPLFPLSLGDQLVEVIVTSRDGAITRTYTVNVTRETPGELSVFRTASSSPENELTDNIGTVSLGTIGFGQDVITETFTLRNSGTTQLSNLEVSLGTVGQPTSFSLGGLSATTLAPGQSLTFTVTFSPAAVGTDTAQLLIGSDDTDESVFEVNLSATTGPSEIPALSALGVSGPGPSPAFSPATLAYTVSDSGTLALWPRVADPMTRIEARVNGSAFQAVNPVQTIASAANFNYVLRPNGTLAAWGADGEGESATIPSEASSNLIGIAVDGSRQIALTNTGRVIVWGISGNLLSVPAAASSGIVGVSSSSGVTLALSSHGSLVCWDYTGQRPLPASFTSFVFVGIAPGYPNSFALRSNGSVVSWDTISGVETSVPGVALSGVKAITSGAGFCLTLKENGAVVAFGNINGQPVVIPKGVESGVVALSCYYNHVIALKSDGTVIDWNAQSGLASSPPTATGLVAVSAGSAHGLGLKTDGNLVAWGSNYANASTIPTGLTGTPQSNGSSAAILALNAGANAVELRLTARDGLTTQTYTFNVTQTPSAADVWRQTHFATLENTGNAADLADPDGDGLSNLMEFATGSSPLSHNHFSSPAGLASGSLTFTFPRSKAAVADGINYRVEWSDSLPGTSWSSQIISETATDQGDSDLVIVALSPGDGSQRFVRLVVRRP